MHHLRLLWLTALCALTLGCLSRSMPGGFSKVSVSSPSVVEAARFAVAAQSRALAGAGGGQPVSLELVKVLRAEAQVVAGMNYRLTLRVKEQGTARTVVAEVWSQPWQKDAPYQLTSWQ